ncbi:MAG: YgiQ family radical SAM protein [Acidaminococcales bacterium]|jgi:uncharacterized radical SAM protein YgiQ|nr:YgiQ family radical SAM protein [Acidaminococcales bacterium]
MCGDFLVMSKEDMEKRGWRQLDFLFISGDAYVDHPSFSTAVIGRVLEREGYKVGLICQPDWRSVQDFKSLGRPRLGVLVSAGNLDSMLNKYTAARKERGADDYSPGGQPNRRPDRATIVYCNRIRQVWKNIPLIVGGIEASLRRFTHYDHWSDSIRHSVLINCKADILVYGMGERQIVAIADCLAGGMTPDRIRHIDGTAFVESNVEALDGDRVELPSHEAIVNDKAAFARAFRLQDEQQDPIRGKTLTQKSGDVYVVQRKPAYPLSDAELDAVYDLPYQRTYHPSYEIYGGVPASQEVSCGIVSHRGCFGACAFCAIHAHQGRIIQARSHDSILREAKAIAKLPWFKGYISDLGGPTANFRHAACKKQLKQGCCVNRQCLFPKPCANLEADHSDYLALLQKLRKIEGVKKVFIRSGIRYDYLLADKNDDFLRELCRHHISGQLKIAPEHINKKVLAAMRKPGREQYLQFVEKYGKMNKEIGKRQYLVPYYMSGHPGATLEHAVELAEFIRDTGQFPKQVQEFIPTPGSCATAMYYSEIDPFTGQKLHVAKSAGNKAMQRALLQYKNPKNYRLVFRALEETGRLDLAGSGKGCLITGAARPKTRTPGGAKQRAAKSGADAASIQCKEKLPLREVSFNALPPQVKNQKPSPAKRKRRRGG